MMMMMTMISLPADELAACPPTCPAPNPKAINEGFDDAIFGAWPSPELTPLPPELRPEVTLATPRGRGMLGLEDGGGGVSSGPERGPVSIRKYRHQT